MHDYVIVGAGSAGCVVANRLSEDPDVSVLLLEAGGPDTPDEIAMPLAFSALYRSSYDWDYDTHFEKDAGNRRIFLPRGKTYGGSSSMNAMIYIRGNEVDYDEWGVPGFSWAEMLPAFKKSEDNERGASEYHGAGGPMRVSEIRSGLELTDAWVQAGVNAGHPLNEDFNGASQDGIGRFQATIRNGRRDSTSRAFLHPFMDRPKLDVEPFAQATRIIIEDGRATGVEISRLGETTVFEAAREVIICAGAYNSPQLLNQSGIGGRAELEQWGIPCLVDLPEVGKNLSDHANNFIVFESDQPVSLHECVTEESLAEWMEGRGILTSNVGEAGGFLRTKEGLNAPDIQFHFCLGIYIEEGLVPAPSHGFSISITVLKPYSRGTVALCSPDPLAKPMIRHNYLSDERDVETTLAGLRLLQEIAYTDPLKGYISRPYPGYYPADDSDEALREHIRNRTIPLYHPVGTCRMGTDEGSVVDPELRVRGVEGLRVVDASVMPTLPRGNTNAPTIAIGERAAEIIRGNAEAATAQERVPIHA